MPKKTFEDAKKAQAIFLTQVKNNQKTLLHQIQNGCRQQKPVEVFESDWEKHHGRLEHRYYESFDSLPMLKKWQDEWGEIAQVVRVTRYRERLSPNPKPSREVSYYALNRRLSIQDIQKAIRRHWHIENRYHHVKDNAFQEDKIPRRINPIIFSTLIDFALNRLRKNGCENIKGILYENSINFNKLIKQSDLIN